MPKNKVIFVRTTPDKHEQIKEEAEKESRSLGNFLVWVFDWYMKVKNAKE